MSLFDRVAPIAETTEVDKTGKVSCGVFVPLPFALAKHFPDKSHEDDSPPHVTILYIGEVTPEEQKTVVAVCREVVKDWPPFTMNVAEYGEFTNEKGQTIAHMEPTATIRVKGPAGIYYRTIGELHADLYSTVEAAGIKVGHTYGKSKSKTFNKRAENFKLHTTLAYVNKGEPAYAGPKPTGNFTVTEVEVWGWETYKLPLGKTTADQPTGEPAIARDPEVHTMKNESKSRFLALALAEEGGAGNAAVEPKAGDKSDKKSKKASPEDERATKLKAALDRHLDPGKNKQPGVERADQEDEKPEFNPHHEHGHSIIVGVKHGEHPNLAPETIEKIKKHAKHGVHHEGPELDGDEGVSQFVHGHLGGEAKSWEAPEPTPGDPRWHPHLALSLFGGSTKAIHDQVTTHEKYDPKKSVHDNLLATGDAWHHPEHGHHVSSHDLNHLVKSVSDDPAAAEVHPDAKNLHKLLHGGMEGFKKFHKAGFAAAFPQDSGHHEHHTKIARIADTANAARDAHLAHQMRTKGGVYFAGKDHVPAVAARLMRGGEKEESAGSPARTGSLFDRALDSIVSERPQVGVRFPIGDTGYTAMLCDGGPECPDHQREQSDMPSKYQSAPVGSSRTGVGTAPPPEVGSIPLQTIKVAKPGKQMRQSNT